MTSDYKEMTSMMVISLTWIKFDIVYVEELFWKELIFKQGQMRGKDQTSSEMGQVFNPTGNNLWELKVLWLTFFIFHS